MSESIEIPTSVAEITAVWLTKALRAIQTIQTATVTGIRAEPVGDVAALSLPIGGIGRCL